MLSEQMKTVSAEELAYETMRFLARQAANRPLVYALVERDVQRWGRMTIEQKREALRRCSWRVGATCPWVRNKGLVRDALAAFEA